MFSKIKKYAIKRMIAVFSLVAFLVGGVSCTTFAEKDSIGYTQRCGFILNLIGAFSDTQVSKLLDEEINEFINCAPDVFVFSEELTDNIDHRLLLASLTKLNQLFDKYDIFTKEFIEYKRKNNEKFELKLIDENSCTIMETYNMSFINFNVRYLDDYKRFCDTIFDSFKDKSPYDIEQLLVQPITHEFGHVVEAFFEKIDDLNNDRDRLWEMEEGLWNKQSELNNRCDELDNRYDELWNDYDVLRQKQNKLWENEDKLNEKLIQLDEIYDKLELKAIRAELKNVNLELENVEEAMENVHKNTEGINEEKEILNIKLENIEAKFNDLNSKMKSEFFNPFEYSIQNEILDGLEGEAREISEYGNVSAGEFFAEAFAHLECTESPDNVNEIGKRLENYLVNIMKFLPKEKSKFNK